VSQSHLLIEASRSHSGTPHSVGILWTSDRSNADYLTTHNILKRQTFIHRRDSNPQTEQASGRRPTACRLDASLPEDRSKPSFETSFFNFRRRKKFKKGDCVSELYTIVQVHRYGSHFQTNKLFCITFRYALNCHLIYSEIRIQAYAFYKPEVRQDFFSLIFSKIK